MQHARGGSWGGGDWVTTDYICASNAHRSSFLYGDCPVVTLARLLFNAQTRQQMLLNCKMRLRIIAVSSSNKMYWIKYVNEWRWQHQSLQQDGFAEGPGADPVCRPSVHAVSHETPFDLQNRPELAAETQHLAIIGNICTPQCDGCCNRVVNVSPSDS